VTAIKWRRHLWPCYIVHALYISISCSLQVNCLRVTDRDAVSGADAGGPKDMGVNNGGTKGKSPRIWSGDANANCPT